MDVPVPVAVQSVDPCVGYDQVVFRLVGSIPGAQGTFEPALDVNPDGSWGGTIVLQSGVTPGSYGLRADCFETAAGGGSTRYATISFAVTLPDTTPPTITATATPAPNVNGWNNADVTVSYTCTDGGSGVDQGASSLGSDVLTASGTAAGICVDLAGNSADASYTAQIDKLKPTITATATPAPNVNGWNNADVTVSYACTDGGSGVDQGASSLGSDVLTASGTAAGICVDLAGNSADASYTAQIDKVSPTVSYADNAGTYGLLDTVAITCTAADALSGLVSSTCANANGSAWSFGAGAHSLSATATDRAGNTGSGSTTFTVVVTPANLSALTRQFVQSSPRYQALRPVQKAAVDLLVSAASRLLLDIGPTASPAQKARFVNAYKQAVKALVPPGWLSAGQATTLSALANAI